MMTANSNGEVVELPPDWKKLAIGDITIRTKQRDPGRNPTVPFRYIDVSSVSNSSFKIIGASEIFPVPQSWDVVKLGDLFGIKHGFAFDGEFFKETGEYILL